MSTQPQEVITASDSNTEISQMHTNTVELAIRLGYEGALNIGALEDEIRFYQQRSVEACLELGKRLLILKEMTPHGEFTKRIDLLGISDRMAQKFMSATIKFSKTNSDSLLKAAGNQTKLLELVTLDDGDLEELSQGGTVSGITLDDIETMSVRELKTALRNSRADGAAKDQLIETKNKKIDDLDTNLTRLSNPSAAAKAALADQRESEAKKALDEISHVFLAALLQYNHQIAEMQVIASEESIVGLHDRIDESVTATYQRIAQASVDLGIQINFEQMVNPEWMSLPAITPHTESEV